MKDHACTDADTALRLYAFLEKELKDRNIDRQFEERTMPLARTLMNLEKDGLPVDRKRLEQVRTQLVGRMHEVKKRVIDCIGGVIDLDSHDEIQRETSASRDTGW
jgi:DNA polymerase I-like protein with 3'-5' exonuclease and polymerase domains